jgi:hypothetical protein
MLHNSNPLAQRQGVHQEVSPVPELSSGFVNLGNVRAGQGQRQGISLPQVVKRLLLVRPQFLQQRLDGGRVNLFTRYQGITDLITINGQRITSALKLKDRVHQIAPLEKRSG